ncbi:DUF3597 domain-containing protein [Rhizobium sp. XQZ8]|uniref:DUF3597 domain-containing protein n=1 Tax=Rhizobium populisoli TaxID=2859785 RepID=UPI001C66DA66|nr:DUF3597 domain-containing protein [Rhizobium populisoli]MBW6425527.1 DUF3597 domain-containing protein [Rhizobium populisoli]
MSIFDRIKHAIFGQAHAAAAPQAAAPAASSSPTPAPTNASPAASSAPSSGSVSAPSTSANPAAGKSAQSQLSSSSAAAPTSGVASSSSVDVETTLNDAVKKSGQKLDWRHSIVDLMKALGMDASLEERKELAQELGYTGDTHDSAKMNTFLHKALMKKLSENGGKVPSDLLD